MFMQDNNHLASELQIHTSMTLADYKSVYMDIMILQDAFTKKYIQYPYFKNLFSLKMHTFLNGKKTYIQTP